MESGWADNFSADIPQLLYFSDSHLLTVTEGTPCFLCATSNLSLKCWPFVPCCPSLLGSGFSLPSNTDSDTFFASPCLLLCCILDTSVRLTIQYRTIFSSPILLPHPASSSHFGAYRSTPRRSAQKKALQWKERPNLESVGGIVLWILVGRVFGSQTTACHDSSSRVSQILTSSTLNHIV